MTDAHVACVAVEDEFRVVFVYCVVCKMHVLSLQIGNVWFDIGFRC